MVKGRYNLSTEAFQAIDTVDTLYNTTSETSSLKQGEHWSLPEQAVASHNMQMVSNPAHQPTKQQLWLK
jgi:hypothetical protein